MPRSIDLISDGSANHATTISTGRTEESRRGLTDRPLQSMAPGCGPPPSLGLGWAPRGFLASSACGSVDLSAGVQSSCRKASLARAHNSVLVRRARFHCKSAIWCLGDIYIWIGRRRAAIYFFALRLLSERIRSTEIWRPLSRRLIFFLVNGQLMFQFRVDTS